MKGGGGERGERAGPSEPDLADGDPLHGVHHQHAGDEIAAAVGEVARQRVDAGPDLFEELGNALVVEGQGAAEQGVENDAAAPDVDLGAGIHVARDHLRRRVVRAAARRPQELPVPRHVRESKVRDLHVLVRVQQQVLRLQIPVHHAVVVAVLHAGHDLLEEAARLRFGQLLEWDSARVTRRRRDEGAGNGAKGAPPAQPRTRPRCTM